MDNPFSGIKACVFDAYGTLFDVHSAVARHRPRLGERADAVSTTWRTKQLEYTWLRSLMGRYVDFWQVTTHALDFALDQQGVEDAALRADLLDAYLTLECYPEVPEVLTALRAAGIKTAVLSNGSPMMLGSAVDNSGIGELLDAVISVDRLGVFKPDMRVYHSAIETLDVGRDQVSFQSSNAWDAAAAATFGFKVAWCNRFGQARERLPDAPHAEIRTLSELPSLLQR
jgi:2-haloacid dehalogenase